MKELLSNIKNKGSKAKIFKSNICLLYITLKGYVYRNQREPVCVCVCDIRAMSETGSLNLKDECIDCLLLWGNALKGGNVAITPDIFSPIPTFLN